MKVLSEKITLIEYLNAILNCFIEDTNNNASKLFHAVKEKRLYPTPDAYLTSPLVFLTGISKLIQSKLDH